MFKTNRFYNTHLFALFLAFILFSGCKQKDQPVNYFSHKAISESLLSSNGEQITFDTLLKENEGKPLLIEVWASWCGDCIAAMPKVKEIQEKHPNINYVFISMDKTPDHWKNGIEKNMLKGKHYMANDQMGGVFAEAIDLDWIPRYILLDRVGKILIYNAIESDLDLIEKKITELELK